MSRVCRSRGFSLIELMITLVIAGIVLAVGLPAFGHFRHTLTLKRANAQLLQDVRRARQLAVTRRAPVVMAFGTPPSTSNITGYTIHVDTNADDVIQGSEMVAHRLMPAGTRLSASLSPVDSIVFDISGTLRPGTLGGRLVFANQLNRRDTLMVSAAGVCYRP